MGVEQVSPRNINCSRALAPPTAPGPAHKPIIGPTQSAVQSCTHSDPHPRPERIPLTQVASGVVTAVHTAARVWVADQGVTITLTGPAAGEAPETQQAGSTLSPRSPSVALTRARHRVTVGAHRTLGVTLTSLFGKKHG